MASNPMQRKSRNSFILGMLLTAVIALVIIAFLVMQLISKNKENAAENFAKICVLTQDVKSGDVITMNMIEEKAHIRKDIVPADAWQDVQSFTDYALVDKAGNNIVSEYSDNEQKLYLINEKENKKYEMKKEEKTGNYYIGNDDNKEYVELDTVPLVASIDMQAKTVLTRSLVVKQGSESEDDVRREEYNVVVMPMDLETGDYIDIRLMVNGQNFIVVSKKEVEIPEIDGAMSTDTMWLKLSEDEILYMSDAIITAAGIPGAKLYAVKYTQPGTQKEAVPTFVVSEDTRELIQRDPNILEKAEATLQERLNSEAYEKIRNPLINSAIDGEDSYIENAQSAMNESMTTSLETRKQYWDALATESAVTTTTK